MCSRDKTQGEVESGSTLKQGDPRVYLLRFMGPLSSEVSCWMSIVLDFYQCYLRNTWVYFLKKKDEDEVLDGSWSGRPLLKTIRELIQVIENKKWVGFM